VNILLKGIRSGTWLICFHTQPEDSRKYFPPWKEGKFNTVSLKERNLLSSKQGKEMTLCFSLKGRNKKNKDSIFPTDL
jgi:hypothetical protein